MPAVTLAKTGQRYSHEEWVALSESDQSTMLTKFGPGYTDEAWARNKQQQITNDHLKRKSMPFRKFSTRT